MHNSFFGAREQSNYTLGYPPLGVAWGKSIKFDSSDDWSVSELDTGYNKGSQFTFLGTAERKFGVFYVFDCRVICPVGDGQNRLTVSVRKNNSEIYRETHVVYKKDTQITGAFKISLNAHDSLCVMLQAMELINIVELLAKHPHASLFKVEEYH